MKKHVLRYFQVGFLVLAGIVLLWPCLKGEFLLWDDKQLILNNADLQSLSVDGFWRLWTQPTDYLYIPLVYTMWFLTASFSGDFVASHFHALNFILHILNAVLIYYVTPGLARQLFPKIREQSKWLGMLAAMTFMMHPMQMEVLSWITAVKDSLYTFLLLASLLCFLRAGRWSYILSIVLFVFAMTAKPSAVIFPVVLLIVQFDDLKTIRTWGLKLLPYFIFALPCIYSTMAKQPVHALLYVPDWPQRFLVAADSICFYLKHFIWPTNISPDYGRFPLAIVGQTDFLIKECFVLVTMLGWSFYLIKEKNGFGKIILLIVATLLPVSGLTPFYYQQISTVADRYFYFSMYWCCLGFSVLALQNIFPFSGLRVLISLALALFVAVDFSLIEKWQNDQVFFHWMLRQNPVSFNAMNSLGDLEFSDSKPAKAEEWYRKSLLAQAWQPYPAVKLSEALAAQGMKDQAVKNLEGLLVKYPGYKTAEEALQQLRQH